MKRNRFRGITESNYTSNYPNRRSIIFDNITKWTIKTEMWECPDGTGFWVVISKQSEKILEYQIIKRYKIDRDANVIEELDSLDS